MYFKFLYNYKIFCIFQNEKITHCSKHQTSNFSIDIDNNNENEPPNSSKHYINNEDFSPLERVESLSVIEINIRFNEDLQCKHGKNQLIF